jgi:uncharacterized protein (DUF58 family)
MQGVHGRRRSGQGDAFWQFRSFLPGDSATRIDWRQSAKSDRLFIRETEWEAAQTVALWRDNSASMAWRSGPAVPLKRERAELLLVATASLLLRGGEQVRLIGDVGRNHTGRAGLEAVAAALGGTAPGGDAAAGEPGVPPNDPALPRHARAVLFGDFLAPLDDMRRSVSALAGRPLRGHLVQILDPAEETLPLPRPHPVRGAGSRGAELGAARGARAGTVRGTVAASSRGGCGHRRRGGLGFLDAPDRSTGGASAAGVVAGAGATIGARHMPSVTC